VYKDSTPGRLRRVCASGHIFISTDEFVVDPRRIDFRSECVTFPIVCNSFPTRSMFAYVTVTLLDNIGRQNFEMRCILPIVQLKQPGRNNCHPEEHQRRIFFDLFHPTRGGLRGNEYGTFLYYLFRIE
jgi:hypothetical protein